MNDKYQDKYQVISIVPGGLRSYRSREGAREVRVGVAVCESVRGPLRHSYRDGWALGPAGKEGAWEPEEIEFIPIALRPHGDAPEFRRTQERAEMAVSEALAAPQTEVGSPPSLTHRMDLQRVRTR